MRAALNALQTLIGALVGCAFLFALALNFANVVGRYAFHTPIYWAEEVMIFTFAWCVFLGAGLVALRSDHLRVELLEWVMPAAVRRLLAMVVHVATAVVMAFVAWRAWTLVELVLRLQQTSIIAEIPMGVPYGAVLVGSVLLVLASLVRVAEVVLGIERRVEKPAVAA